MAAEIQGLPAAIIPHERDEAEAGASRETRSADAILAEILQPTESSWGRLHDVAALAEQAKSENHPNRDGLIATALGAVESAEAFGRYIELHDIRLMARLYANLTEPERWRLLGAITAITGDIRAELIDAHWAFTVAFSAVNLACRARAAEAGHGFTHAIFRQLLGMHWKWHGVPPSSAPLTVPSTPGTWPDAARRMLLSLTQTDGCETLYMVMCGLRFFADIFPEQIPALCREGLAEENATDALLPLAQLWATRHPRALALALPDFEVRETTGTLDDRLDAWAVGALFGLVTGERPRNFRVPATDTTPEIAFPGDAQLFEADVEMNGLIRHNSFARMANERLRRVGGVLGSMETAFRHLVRAIRQATGPVPSLYMRPAKKLAFDSNFPRPSKHMENLVGDAILHQCADQEWPPGRSAAVRLAIGYGMDPWIASATPNPWPDKKAWPSDFDVERWMEAGAPNTADIAQQISALLEGEDVAPDTLQLGAVLRIPTYRRDLEFRFWLTPPRAAEDLAKKVISSTPSWPHARELARRLVLAATQAPGGVSVQFAGTLVNYPNSELDVTPTDQWTREWGWAPDPG